MIDGETSPGNYKTFNITIAAIKSFEMLKFITDHFKTTKICKKAIKKLPFLIMHAPDQYKTQEMCGQVFLENGGMLRCIPDCDKNQKMC